jgi:hypothetical protein
MCETCDDTKEIMVVRARTIGYTATDGEIVDEHIEPCPECN